MGVAIQSRVQSIVALSRGDLVGPFRSVALGHMALGGRRRLGEQRPVRAELVSEEQSQGEKCGGGNGPEPGVLHAVACGPLRQGAHAPHGVVMERNLEGSFRHASGVALQRFAQVCVVGIGWGGVILHGGDVD